VPLVAGDGRIDVLDRVASAVRELSSPRNGNAQQQGCMSCPILAKTKRGVTPARIQGKGIAAKSEIKVPTPGA
jgi:hypothetical protein